MEEVQRLEEARLVEESALTLVKREKTKSKVDIEAHNRKGAAALAALNSAFSSSSGLKRGASPKPALVSSGSQRAAAVAALSSVLSTEKKDSPPLSSLRSGRTTPTEPVLSGKSENLPEVEDSVETSKVEESEVVQPASESNEEESEPKPEAEQDENGS